MHSKQGAGNQIVTFRNLVKNWLQVWKKICFLHVLEIIIITLNQNSALQQHPCFYNWPSVCMSKCPCCTPNCLRRLCDWCVNDYSGPGPRCLRCVTCVMCVLPPDGAQQRGSGLVVEGDDDGGWRKIRVIMKSGAPTRERESMIKHDIRSTRWKACPTL